MSSEDLRVKRTLKHLESGYLKLAETRSYEEISVVDICSAADVHRASFYKHFKDKPDFLNYITRHKIQEFYEQTLPLAPYSSTKEFYSTFATLAVQFLTENKQMLLNTVNTDNVGTFYDAICVALSQNITNFIAITEENGKPHKEVSPEFISDFIAGGLITVLYNWLKSPNDEETNEQFIQDITKTCCSLDDLLATSIE